MRRPWAVALITLLTVRYLHWRLSATLNLDTPLAAVLSLLLLAAECWLLGHGLLQLLLSLAPLRWGDPPIAAAAAALRRRREQQPEALPWVDVLVPSYGEPLPVLERCLQGCIAMAYPRRAVWLLDDAGRPELLALARRLGCHYLSREQRLHAKAGNLNQALPLLHGELIAVFDADVVPVRGFLERTVGLFDAADVGLVQTPQTSMNADPVIRNLGLERWLLPDEECFYRWIEPLRQRLKAVVCAGTSFVVRRQALLAVGGFETDTPSEDLATGIRLTAAGWHCLYVPEKLSAGLAPLTLAALVRQRCRWAGGTLQTLRSGANPLRIPGLNPLQRLAFLEGILHWLNALPQLLLLLMPLSLGVLGVTPLRVSGAGLLTVALPLLLAQLLLTRWISSQSRTALLPELYRLALLVPLSWTVIRTLLGRSQPFRVTPKDLASGRRPAPERRLLLPLLGLLSLQLVALRHLLPLLHGGGPPGLVRASASTLALGLSWTLLNALLLIAALRCCQDRARDSATPWLGWGEAVRLDGAEAWLEAISEDGVELSLQNPWQGKRWLAGTTLELIRPDGSRWPVRLAAGSGHRLGCRWGVLSEEQWQRLQRLLYQRDGQWPQRRAPAEPLALLVALQRLCRPLPAEDWFRRSLVPVQPPLPPLPARQHPGTPRR